MPDSETRRPFPLRVAVGGTALCAGLVGAGLGWPDVWVAPETNAAAAQPFVDSFKLVIAALVGWLVTTVHRPTVQKRRARAIAHAQSLFCVAGALMMIIIGDSFARAFGAFGIASMVRFRTALKDPKDATVLFLLIGLGMSAGRGILAVTGLGTMFLCLLLWTLDRDPQKPDVATLVADASLKEGTS